MYYKKKLVKSCACLSIHKFSAINLHLKKILQNFFRIIFMHSHQKINIKKNQDDVIEVKFIVIRNSFQKTFIWFNNLIKFLCDFKRNGFIHEKISFFHN